MKLTTTPVRRRLLALALTVTATTFTAAPAALGDSCPNAAYRTGLSANLPACRAYEMVSPVDKGDGDVDSHFTVQSAPGGEAVAYDSSTALPGAPASIGGNYNLARRRSGGWVTQAIDPPEDNSVSSILTVTEAMSEDLSHSLVLSRVALAPGAVEGNGNLYIQDNETGQRTLVATSGNRYFFGNGAINAGSLFTGGTPDLDHIIFSSQYPLTPDAEEGAANLYEWSSSGGLRLANKLADGSIGGSAGPLLGTHYSNPISQDGRRVFFESALYPYALYVSTDGGVPQLISHSQRSGDDPSEPLEGAFEAASSDGSVVYFNSDANLTNGPGVAGAPGELYRYEVASGQLTDISSSPTGGQVWKVLQASADGSYVYFAALGALAPEAQSGQAHIYLWHNGVTHLVATLEESEFTGPGGFSLSHNGNWFTFTSIGHPTGYDNASPACKGNVALGNPAGSCPEVFLYDAASEHLVCVSCRPGARPEGEADLGNQAGIISHYLGLNVLDDGRTFFETTDSLVPADSNGRLDVYEYAGGTVSLISPGVGNQDAQFKDVTPDGRNVYFLTRQQLVAQDIDSSQDLYDARVEGGFPAPAPEGACTGTGCQGVPPAQPIFATPPSVTFNGVGNFAPQPKATPKAKPKRKPAKHAKPKKKNSRRQARRSPSKSTHKSSKSSTRRAGR